MALADVFFTPSILITLAICLILISALGLFFIQKLNQQNHKINTMFDLVNTLAQEMNFLKSSGISETSAPQGPHAETPDSINQMQYDVNAALQTAGMSHNMTEADMGTHSINMIDVSEDESDGSDIVEDSDDDESEDDDDESEDDDDESEDDDDESEDDDDNEEENDSEPIDLGGINMESITITPSELNELADVPDISSAEDIETQELVEELAEQLSSVKNLDIVIDYKKASLPKLREVIQAKGIVEDASKMKKADILKLLEE